MRGIVAADGARGQQFFHRNREAESGLEYLAVTGKKNQIDLHPVNGYLRGVNCTLNLRLSLRDALLLNCAAVGF